MMLHVTVIHANVASEDVINTMLCFSLRAETADLSWVTFAVSELIEKNGLNSLLRAETLFSKQTNKQKHFN